MESMALELELSEQPFQVKYEQHAHLATSSWMIFVWEKVDMFNFKIVVNNLQLKPPRKGNKWLIAKFVWLNYSKQDLLRLNRVRLHNKLSFSRTYCVQKERILTRVI